MFLPIGDTPNPPNFRPWTNWLLLAANLAIYLFFTLPMSMIGADPEDPRLAGYLYAVRDRVPPGISAAEWAAHLTQWDLFVWEWGYKPGAPQIADLVVSMFLHAGLAHVAGNLLFLWIYGDNVEHRLGRVGYLATYGATGLAATLGFAALAGGSSVPLIGASGAISGVLGVYFLLFPRNFVRVFVALFPVVVNVWLVPARIVLGAYVILDNLLPLLGGTQSGVAHGAHLGGFVAGLAIAWVGERYDWRAPTARVPREVSVDLRLQGAGRLAAEGRIADAVRSLQRGLRGASDEDSARLNLAISEMHLREGALTSAYQRLVLALRHPTTAARARAILSRLPIDPRLLARHGIGR